jgi:hypothetical protein
MANALLKIGYRLIVEIAMIRMTGVAFRMTGE